MYLAPRSQAELLAAIGAHPQAAITGGGTRLMALPLHERPQQIIDLARCGLGGVRHTEGGLQIGAAARIDELRDLAQPWGALGDAARQFRPEVVRRQATVGGNLAVGGSLCGALAILGAQVRVIGAVGERFAAAASLHLAAGEVIAEVLVDPQPPGQFSGRLAIRRTALGPAICAVCLALVPDGDGWQVRAVVQSAAPQLLVLPAQKFAGADWLAEQLRNLVAQPTDDMRAGGDYRRAMAGVLGQRLAAQLLAT